MINVIAQHEGSHSASQIPATTGLLGSKNDRGPKLSLRVNPANPDHHLWNNNGTWWCHYTEHLPDYTKRRVRVSLRTGDLAAARRRRDKLLFALEANEAVAGKSFPPRR